MTELDMVNRDPNNINDHVQVAFEDVIAEPPGAHSFDCVWSSSHSLFEFGKSCSYNVLTILCGLCIALEWGCEFGYLAFYHVWIATPTLRIYAIQMGYCQKYLSICINAYFAPIMETCGLCFSKITVVNKTG